ncbi:uncharacterized protein LOC129300591 isoform X2 [Prosopis cineraria]|uniref:uncharacterized protein LOC129300591 isoform X2 n=1 Tax=Prosopis cineraria TaxID=364024 RepID=UPI0024107283|nr:uncharacterized protein LOC129300591 isoform X2 [Prosopis cineraria]
MSGLMGSPSVLLCISVPNPLTPPPPTAASFASPVIFRRCSTKSASAISSELTPKPETSKSIPLPSTEILASTAPPIHGVKNLGFQPKPELGLLSILFPLSMAFGAFLSVALASIPTIIAFGRLGASMKKLSRVASEEVPGTLSSLKLSGMELNDLAQQLRNLRHIISGIRTGTKDRDTKNAGSSRKKEPVS